MRFGRKIAVGNVARCLSTCELLVGIITVRRRALQGLRSLVLEHLGLVGVLWLGLMLLSEGSKYRVVVIESEK